MITVYYDSDSANYYIPTNFLYGILLTHQDFLLAKADVAYVVFLYLGQDIWLIDLFFHRKEDKRDFHNKRRCHFFQYFENCTI